MKKYRVLWFNDEFETLDLIIDQAVINGISLFPYNNVEDGVKELERNIHYYDAVIVDGRLYKKPGQSGDALDDNAWVLIARNFDKWDDKKKLPWFILSGQVSITGGKNTFVEIYKDNKVYDKLNEDDIQSLWEDIKAAADAQSDTQIRHKYESVFDVCTDRYIGAESAKSLLYLLNTVESDNHKQETEEKINAIRKVVEKILTAFNRIGIMPSEVLKGKGGMNVSSRFLRNNHPSYSFTTEIMPPAIRFLFQKYHGNHTRWLSLRRQLSIKADQFIKSQPTGYFFNSVVFQLLEVLVWLKSYFDKNQDHDKNKLIALPNEVQPAIYDGVIEQDSQRNYFCGEYLLGYNAVNGKYKPGDKITITEVSANSQPKTSHLYTKFASKFIKT